MSTSSDVYSEEPYALIGHVRFCEGEVRAQNGAYPLYSTLVTAHSLVKTALYPLAFIFALGQFGFSLCKLFAEKFNLFLFRRHEHPRKEWMNFTS